MIACTRCSKENQDHYKFCLGCGAELPRDAAKAAKAQKPQTPPSGFAKADKQSPAPAAEKPASPSAAPAPKAAAKAEPAVPSFGGAPAKNAPPPAKGAPVPAPAAAAPSAPAAGGATVTCEKCAKVNPVSFKFCGACGHNLQAQQAQQSGAAPPPAASAPAPAPASTPAQRGALVLIRPDGTEGESFALAAGETPVGRSAGGLFASDTYLSPKHATFAFVGDDLFVTDEGSLNGVYWRVEAEVPTPLEDGSVFRIGQEILRFSTIPAPKAAGGVDVAGSPNPGFLGRIALVTGRDATANAYCIPAEGLHLGRERGDIIFPEDGYVSGLHCRIHSDKGHVVITDVGSSNGTFIRVKGKHKLASGMLVLMGQQLFRVEY